MPVRLVNLKSCQQTEAGHAGRVMGEDFWQDFDRYIAAELGIAGAVDLAHPARTDSSGDFIGAEPGTH